MTAPLQEGQRVGTLDADSLYTDIPDIVWGRPCKNRDHAVPENGRKSSDPGCRSFDQLRRCQPSFETDITP